MRGVLRALVESPVNGNPTGMAPLTGRRSLVGFASPPFDGFAFVAGTVALRSRRSVMVRWEIAN
jgi:hypothetical protein